MPNFNLFFNSKHTAPESGVSNLEAEVVDSRSVRVNWLPPPAHTHNGPLKGYYVGYRRLSNDQVLYKTLELSDSNQKSVLNSDDDPTSPTSASANSSTSDLLSIVLTNLKPYTEYLITVQPFNSIGSGPASSAISIRTLEDGELMVSKLVLVGFILLNLFH